MEMIRRKIWMAVAALVWMAGAAAVGQNVQRIQTKISPTNASTNNESGKHTDGKTLGINSIINGISDPYSWWKAAKSEEVTITITFSEPFFLTSIQFDGGNAKNERPTEIKVETSTDGQNYNTAQTYSNLSNQGDEDTGVYSPFTLNNPIETQYVRLVITPQTGGLIAIDEVEFFAIPEIKHKAAKWHAQRTTSGNRYVDTFDDTKFYTYNGQTDIQAAHTLVETLYMSKDNTNGIILTLPDRDGGIDNGNAATNIGSYQRWYNFETDGIFGNNVLTPLEGTFYQFANGYVNRPKVEWNASLPSRMKFMPSGNANSYLVACDISSYTDFSENGSIQDFGSNGEYWEPTLTHRVIYQIILIETNNRSIEEYEINFPAYILPNVTHEMVSLSMDARSYLAGTDATDLYVTIENNTAGISLLNQAESWNGGQAKTTDNSKNYPYTGVDGNSRVTLTVAETTTVTLSGDDRAIFFGMPESSKNGDGTLHVPDGSSATIVVKAGNGTDASVVARFKLNFTDESRLLSQTIVNRLDGTDKTSIPDDATWKNLSYRTPNILNEEQILLTELNFDYESSYGQGLGNRFYPFPLAWESSTYGFYDGSQDGYEGGNNRDRRYPEYGAYSIMKAENGYVECSFGGNNWAWNGSTSIVPPILSNSAGDNSTYHLYADASDRPGILARLKFEENLCPGSALYVSAWVKSARWTDNNTAVIRDNAAMLFTIMGVTEEDGEEPVYTPIYRHQTGQIPAPYSVNNQDLDLPGINSDNGGTNEWYQTYFSFVNSGNLDYDYYVLQVDNNSASTNGGDMYLDDIRVYVARPMAEVEQLTTACTPGRTQMSLRIDWERFSQRIGNSTGGDLGICFVDTLIFHNTYSKEKNNIAEALNAAVVDLGQTEENSRHFRMLHYHGEFNAHKEYTTAGTHVAAANNYYFYRLTTKEGMKYLAVDFYGDMIPNRAYWVVMVQGDFTPEGHTSEDDLHNLDADDFLGFYTDPCALVADFKVKGDRIIKMNGEIVDPDNDYCKGNIYDFTLNVQIHDEETDQDVIITEGISYDWFFGLSNDPKVEFEEVNTKYGVSMQEALSVFRDLFPEANSLDGITPGTYPTVADPDETLEFTKEMYDIINYYLTTDPSGGINRPLVLNRPNLAITLLDFMRVVVCPIPTIKPDDINAEIWNKICWGYQYIELEATESAPSVHAGFNSIQYPADDMYEPALRIGLAQIEETETRGLIIDLRDATPSSDEIADNEFELGMVTEGENKIYDKIYLFDTDDPEMKEFIDQQGDEFDQLSLPIGKVMSFEAHRYIAGGTQRTNQMKIQFDRTTETSVEGMSKPFRFHPKEGYEYRFVAFFEEKVDGGESACFGQLVIPMKVVPEYLVWDDKTTTIGMTGNWNNDDNWRRATNDELNKSGDADSYPTEGNTSGYVPMLFSKVIMPRDSKVKLYAAGFSGSGDNISWAGNENKPADVGDPTLNIQYDLMVFDHENATGMKTERYRVALCDQIHFMPGAEMLYPEFLLYNKAWVDYELEKADWHLLASPLKDVVAGDFYTDEGGTEAQEYFTEITFDKNDNDNSNQNSRLSPTVYQRAWKNKTTEVPLQMDASTKKNVAIQGNWSSVYNNVAERYEPGAGFSLKVQDMTNSTALFRLPKDDSKYSYYTQGSNAASNGQSITRSNPYRLSTDDIYRRESKATSYSEVVRKPIEVPLSKYESANEKYYLVGNPFVSHLDMVKFFTKNADVLQPKYWAVDNGIQNIAIVNDDDENWVSTTGTSVNTIAPLRSFFVQKKDNAEIDAKITFTADMQTLATATTGNGTSTNALLLTATTQDGRQSRAAISYDPAASEGYKASEDAELFLDSNLGDLPMVYTAAGTMAASINRTSGLYNIPVGVYAPGAKGETVSLTFSGVDGFSYATLYDAETRTESPIREGSRFTVPANTAGRYFLRAGVPTANEAVQESAIRIYTVGGGTLVVASTDLLRTVRVYDFAGRLVANETGLRTTQCRIELPEGSYIVKAESERGEEEVKIRM